MIDSFEAQKVISRHRGDAVIIATMTANFEWPQLSTNPGLDLMSSGAMGKASSMGLGLALARPDRRIIVLDGDGSLLMNLGSLVTIAHMAPPNLVHFVFENEVYRTSGGQPVPGVGKVSFPGLARAAGYAEVHDFEDIDSLESNLESVIGKVGPVFICLKIIPARERPPFPFTTTASVISRFRAALDSA